MSEQSGGKASIQAGTEGAVIVLRVVPRASRTKLFVDETGLRLRLAAPPVEGAANDELVRYLAKLFGLRKSDVIILSGGHGRRKRVLLRGLDAGEAARIIERVD
jgi:uncharacterized protein (TIGR00251 family)